MNISDFNAGRYEQRYEYRAFLPVHICHEWVIADPELMDLLGKADRALGELNAFSQLIPDIDFFIRTYVAKEATQSSRIEGTQTNIEDAFKDADDLNPDERGRLDRSTELHSGNSLRHRIAGHLAAVRQAAETNPCRSDAGRAWGNTNCRESFAAARTGLASA
jgi:hypothetical protein